MAVNTCIRCEKTFQGRYPKSKICKQCSKRGAKRGRNHWNYQTGSYTYETIRAEIKHLRRYCERCNKDLLNVSRYFWCIHHKDHNHFNNTIRNLELLCKSCHQKEHDCILNIRNYLGQGLSNK